MKPDRLARALIWLACLLFALGLVLSLNACLRSEPEPPRHDPGVHPATHIPYATGQQRFLAGLLR